MSYPQNPGGPGQGPGGPYPGWQPQSGAYPQQGYPPPQGYPPGYPPQPGYGAYPPMPAPKPGGGTAITSAVLALVIGLWDLFSLVLGLLRLWPVHGFDLHVALVFVMLILAAARAATLLPGSILLLRHKRIGRRLVIIGSGIAVGQTLLSFIPPIGDSVVGIGLGPLGFWILLGEFLIFSTALILAIVRPTAAWCGAAKQPPMPPYGGGGYPQQPGW